MELLLPCLQKNIVRRNIVRYLQKNAHSLSVLQNHADDGYAVLSALRKKSFAENKCKLILKEMNP